jgi:uncharacterized membrane protein
MERPRGSAFLKRLQIDLPGWVQRGWVSRKHQQSILDHVARQERRSSRYTTVVFALMGALLFGAGVITFFAAHWDGIPKVFKLLILFGALGACYAAAGHAEKRRWAALAQGFVFLGVVLFGANIFLIAQIYHIDAHYPNGVLWWALGALAAAALAPSQSALAAALVLMTLWSAMEMFEFTRVPHGWFFIPWSLALPLVYRHRWLVALRVACWTLLLWCLMLPLASKWVGQDWSSGDQLALLQMYVFAGIALYILGRGMWWYPRWSPFSAPIVTAGAVWAVVSLFALTFPRLQRHVSTSPITSGSSVLWFSLTVLALATVAALMVWRYRGTRLSTLPLYRRGAFLWLIAAGAFALANLGSGGHYATAFALAYNVLALAGVIWLVMTGADRREPRIVNMGFLLFAALLIARYVDTFWTLLDRSFFFMLGGALLLVIGFFMERSRRRVNARITAAKGNA